MADKLGRSYSDVTNYRAAYVDCQRTDGEPEKLTRLRNEIVFIQLQWIDEYHYRFLSRLNVNLDVTSRALEIATVGTAAIATGIGGVTAKAAFAGTSTVLGAVKSPLLDGMLKFRIEEAIVYKMVENRETAVKNLRRDLNSKAITELSLAAAEEQALATYFSISPEKALADFQRLVRSDVENRPNESTTTSSTSGSIVDGPKGPPNGAAAPFPVAPK